MNQPFVSIIINSYNYENYLKSAIDSALNQTYPNIEIIVVDDGSTDASPDIIRSYKNQVKPILKSNGGLGSSLNAGFAASSGDIICFLDSDDMFLPFKVAEIVKAFTTLKDIDWVFHPVSELKTDELETEKLKKLVEREPEEAKYVEIDFRNQIVAGKLPGFVPQTSALSFSRQVMEKIFPIPEEEKVYVTDNYMAMACVFLSKGCVIDKKMSLYRLHDSNIYSSMQINRSRECFAKYHIATGYWLRTNFPGLSRYTNKFFSKGLGCFWLIENTDSRYRKYIENYFAYLSLLDKFLVIMLSLYYWKKSLVFKMLP